MVVTLIRNVKDRTRMECPWCRFALYPTHEEHLWVSKNYMGRHLANYHREQMDYAFVELAKIERLHDQSSGFRRGL